MSREFGNTAALVLSVLVLAIGGPWAAKELRSVSRHHALSARAGQRVVTLEVGGMTCSGCAATIQGRLTSVPGVAGAEVRLAQRRAYVVCASSLADSALLGAVERAGPGFLAAVVSN